MSRAATFRTAAVRALAVLALLEAAWLLYPVVRTRVLAVEETPAARGHRLAGELGCFACHGPAGNGATKNPGSEEDSVPAFTERTQMMYVKNADDLREYVLDGAPRRKREDPDYRAKMEAAALRMPAYRGVVTEVQADDLVVYLRSTSGQIVPDEALAARGAELAVEYSCFACHGPLGAGGVPNPRSLKGYVPAFWGADFDDLVRDDEELRTWIAKGEIPRLVEHPVAVRFLRRQIVKMPAYDRFLPPADIDALAAYVRWIRAGAWRPLAPRS
ncbi:MAG TPA: c-type cytochrome [Candidatus Binatia bacterium]|nr:c-type cytochrome [Candidatus Binatia bacterium]